MKILLALFLVLSTQSLVAATKTLTVLDGQKVKTQWDGDMPKATKSRGIETDVTGIMIVDGQLIPTFGFGCSTKKRVLSVVVEDVTGKKPVLMVEDKAPVIAGERWKGNSQARNISATETPWLFAPGDTLTVFRFTVTLESKDGPVIIYQPSVFRDSSKQRLRMLVGK